jgi:sialic acid synthase SpsE
VAETAIAHEALGRVSYAPEASEGAMRKLRRSLYVVADMTEGDIFTAENLRAIRPGLGLAPRHLPDVLGMRASAAIKRGTPLQWELVDDAKPRG